MSTVAINMKPRLLCGLVLGLFLTGCATQNSDIKKYAILRIGDSDKIQVSIEGKFWTPLLTPHGFGGYRRALFCWSSLNGAGPEYRDPVLHVNSPYMQSEHVGVITVDRAKKIVIIKLDQIVQTSPDHGANLGPEPGAHSGPSPENGTYRIKNIIKDDFIKPE
jgi:hypothetical protein